MADPVVAILWGTLVFDDDVRGGPFVVTAVLSAAAASTAVMVLSRSPLLSGDGGQGQNGAPERQDERDGTRTTRTRSPGPMGPWGGSRSGSGPQLETAGAGRALEAHAAPTSARTAARLSRTPLTMV